MNAETWAIIGTFLTGILVTLNVWQVTQLFNLKTKVALIEQKVEMYISQLALEAATMKGKKHETD